MSRLKELYDSVIVQQLQDKFSYKSRMQVPRLVKITINMGVGEAVLNKKAIDSAVADIQAISGQKPIVTHVRKSNAGFKIRAGWPIGCKVTLRRERMYEFLDRFINIAVPLIRDFRGFGTRSFDGMGNYNLGIREQIIFPEIKYDTVDAMRGFDVSISTTAKEDKEAHFLLAAFGFPFKEKD